MSCAHSDRRVIRDEEQNKLSSQATVEGKKIKQRTRPVVLNRKSKKRGQKQRVYLCHFSIHVALINNSH